MGSACSCIAVDPLTGPCPERLLGEPWPWGFRRSWGTQPDLFLVSAIVGQFRVQADDPAFPVLSYQNRRTGVTWAGGFALPCVAIAPELIADFGDRRVGAIEKGSPACRGPFT